MKQITLLSNLLLIGILDMARRATSAYDPFMDKTMIKYAHRRKCIDITMYVLYYIVITLFIQHEFMTKYCKKLNDLHGGYLNP